MLRPGIRRVFRLAIRRPERTSADVDDELRAHVELRVEHLVARGWSRDAAEAEARSRFGPSWDESVRRLRAAGRQREERLAMRDRLDALGQDVRYAARALVRDRRFTAVAVLTFALGIGAVTAIFSVVNHVLLQPLPFRDPDRVTFLGWEWKDGDMAGAVPAGAFQFWRNESRAFEAVTAYRQLSMQVDGRGGGESDTGAEVEALSVTADFFRVTGFAPSLGRAFTAEELTVGGSDVVILTEALWANRFGSDRSAIGRELRLDGRSYTVVGVLPHAFALPAGLSQTRVLLPLRLTAEQLADRGANFGALARLRPGVSLGDARAESDVLVKRYRAAHADLTSPDDRGVIFLDYRRLFVGSDFEAQLWIFLAATGCVLLLACANVGNLLVARAIGRQREMAVRTALGAGRARIMRQLTAESIVLAVLAAAVGLLASALSVRLVLAAAPGVLPPDSSNTFDLRVVVFATGVALASGLLLGTTAGFPTARIDLPRALAEGGRGGSASRRQRRLRDALVTAEAALAVVLLASAGLLVRSFARLASVDPGFVRDGVVTAAVPRAPAGYDSANTVLAFEERVLARVRGMPGVVGAAGTSSLPMQRGWNIPMTLVEFPDRSEGAVQLRAVSPGYFHTLGVRLLHGRDVGDADRRGAPPVVVVSEAFAKYYFPDGKAIGRMIALGRLQGKSILPSLDEPPREIVGVVADAQDVSLGRSARTVFVPQAQVAPGLLRLPAFVVRTSRPQEAAMMLRRAIADADPRMPPAQIAPLDDIVSGSLDRPRFSMLLMTVFAVIAVTLTAAGIYGVVSYAVARRVREIGVRMALGARPRSVVRLVATQGMRPVVVGVVIGLFATVAVTQVLDGMLYGVSPHDPVVLAGVTALVLTLALVASWWPARRASVVDPMVALRAD